jgi:Transposase DDE domain
MSTDSLLNTDWKILVRRLGGARALETGARQTGAFQRARSVKSAVDLLRLVLAYCLGQTGLRATTAWAEGIGLASLSNVALLGRLRNMVPWLEFLVAELLARELPKRNARKGRPIRLVDATIVPRAGKLGRDSGGVWRVHAVYDLPTERFSAFDLTDESEGERLDRAGVVKGEIRIADRGYINVAHMAAVLDAGADIVIRAGWRQVKWLDVNGDSIDLIKLFEASASGRIDRMIWIKQASRRPLGLRLIAIKKPKQQAVIAQAKARRSASDRCRDIMPGTLVAAEWMIILTSLDKARYPTDDVLALYRLRWRIELAFKRLKSLVGLNGPPGEDAVVAKAHVLCHLLAILLTEPLVAAFGDSPRSEIEHSRSSGAAFVC